MVPGGMQMFDSRLLAACTCKPCLVLSLMPPAPAPPQGPSPSNMPAVIGAASFQAVGRPLVLQSVPCFPWGDHPIQTHIPSATPWNGAFQEKDPLTITLGCAFSIHPGARTLPGPLSCGSALLCFLTKLGQSSYLYSGMSTRLGGQPEMAICHHFPFPCAQRCAPEGKKGYNN